MKSGSISYAPRRRAAPGFRILLCGIVPRESAPARPLRSYGGSDTYYNRFHGHLSWLTRSKREAAEGGLNSIIAFLVRATWEGQQASNAPA